MGRCLKSFFGILSIIIALISVGIGYLKLDEVYRQKTFAKLLFKFSDVNNTDVMNLRCNKLLQHSNVHGHVLEIGSGTGINFHCLYNNTNIKSYTGIEPNLHMHPFFYDFISQYDTPYYLRLSNNSAADMYDIESNSIDTVIMTFVLCSLPDPLGEQLLSEAYRVLKPGGKFLFLEHILANPQTDWLLYLFQKLIQPIWTIIGDGCQFKILTNYFDAVKNVYSNVDYQHTKMPEPHYIIKDALIGELIK